MTQKTLIVDGDSSVTVHAGALSAATALTDLLSKTTIAFSRSGDGVFTYEPPTIGLLTSSALNVAEMGAGDKIVIPYPGDGLGGSDMLREDLGAFGAEPAYRDGYLHLKNGGLLNNVTVKIKMTQAQYDLYAADKNTFLNGSSDTFTFPGDDSGEPPYVVPAAPLAR